MIFKTDSGKETLFTECPSRTKIKHFFYTNLLHLKITRADRDTGGTPSKFRQKITTGTFFPWRPHRRRASELRWLSEGWRIHTVPLKQDRVSQCPCVPLEQQSRPARHGAPAHGCARLDPEHQTAFEHQRCAAQTWDLTILHPTNVNSYSALFVAFNSFHL